MKGRIESVREAAASSSSAPGSALLDRVAIWRSMAERFADIARSQAATADRSDAAITTRIARIRYGDPLGTLFEIAMIASFRSYCDYSPDNCIRVIL
jgi:hypothetical protein